MQPVVLWAVFADKTYEDSERGTVIEGVPGHIITLNRGLGEAFGQIHGKLQLHMLVDEGKHRLDILADPPVEYASFADFTVIPDEENLSNQVVVDDFPFLINDEVAVTRFRLGIDGVYAGSAYLTAIRR